MNNLHGRSVGELTPAQIAVLTDMQKSLHILRIDSDAMKQTIHDAKKASERATHKLLYAVYGGFAFGLLVFVLPKSAQPTMEAWVTYASMGAMFGVLMG